MTEKILIQAQHLSKCYRLYEKPIHRLAEALHPFGRKYHRDFFAINDVSFSVRRGETLGIIGRNGAGKSTLLKILAGVTTATSGTLTVQGRVSSLLELGAGFNPELSGLENTYLQGTLIGVSRSEMAAKIDDILAFADIGDFIHQPVKCYSSGMFVRLAFACAIHVDPDILIVDEALAVGDVKFQVKCFDRLAKLKQNGTCILLVTHNSEQVVTHCTQALLLDGGVVIGAGEPRSVANQYMDLLFGRERLLDKPESISASTLSTLSDASAALPALSLQQDCFGSHAGYNPHEYRWGDGTAAILDYCLSTEGKAYPIAVALGQQINLRVSIRFFANMFRPIFGVTIKTKEGVTVYGSNSEALASPSFKDIGGSGTVVIVEASFACRLAAGDYFISLGVAERKGEEIIPHDRRYDSIYLQVRTEPRFFGLADLDLKMQAQECPPA